MKDYKQQTFSYQVNVGHISANPVRVTLEADEKERAAMAERWGVLRVTRVRAELELTRWKRDGVRVKGRVKADIEQNCVVTMEPVEEKIDELVEALFVPEGSKLARINTDENGEMIISAEGPDMPETFTGNTIDVGMVCEEFIVLAIDPYPRKEGAVVALAGNTSSQDDVVPSPFADLERWKKK